MLNNHPRLPTFSSEFRKGFDLLHIQPHQPTSSIRVELRDLVWLFWDARFGKCGNHGGMNAYHLGDQHGLDRIPRLESYRCLEGYH